MPVVLICFSGGFPGHRGRNSLLKPDGRVINLQAKASVHVLAGVMMKLCNVQNSVSALSSGSSLISKCFYKCILFKADGCVINLQERASVYRIFLNIAALE